MATKIDEEDRDLQEALAHGLELLSAQQRVQEVAEQEHADDQAEEIGAPHTRSRNSTNPTNDANTATRRKMAMTSMEPSCDARSSSPHGDRVRGQVVAQDFGIRETRSGSRFRSRCGSRCAPVRSFDLAPQIRDMGAQQARRVGVLRPPYVGQQRPMGQQPAAIDHQDAQQLVFDRSQVDLDFGDGDQMSRKVHCDAIGLQDRVVEPRDPHGAARPAAARRAHLARTAWSRSRRHRFAARGSSPPHRQPPTTQGSECQSTRAGVGRPRRRRCLEA